jgi:hypothetical protein
MAMPPEIEETYNVLRNHMIVIHCRWTIYCQLFGTNPERIGLLNRFGGVAFGAIQRVMEDEAVFALCRISDPAVSGKGKRARGNCTFERLVNLVAADQPQAATVITTLLSELDGLRDACMDEVRNRVLAHLDLSTLANIAAGNPGPVRPNREHIKNFLVLLCHSP